MKVVQEQCPMLFLLRRQRRGRKQGNRGRRVKEHLESSMRLMRWRALRKRLRWISEREPPRRMPQVEGQQCPRVLRIQRARKGEQQEKAP